MYFDSAQEYEGVTESRKAGSSQLMVFPGNEGRGRREGVKVGG